MGTNVGDAGPNGSAGNSCESAGVGKFDDEVDAVDVDVEGEVVIASGANDDRLFEPSELVEFVARCEKRASFGETTPNS